MLGSVQIFTIHLHYEGLQPPAHVCDLPSDAIVVVFWKNLLLGATFSVTLHFLLFFLPRFQPTFLLFDLRAVMSHYHGNNQDVCQGKAKEEF